MWKSSEIVECKQNFGRVCGIVTHGPGGGITLLETDSGRKAESFGGAAKLYLAMCAASVSSLIPVVPFVKSIPTRYRCGAGVRVRT